MRSQTTFTWKANLNTNHYFRVVIMSSVDVGKQIHKEVDRMLKGLSIKNQETVLKEAHNIVESLKNRANNKQS